MTEDRGAFEILDARAAGSRQGGPSFPLRHRLLRAVFGVVWLALARWTPPPFHRWRGMVLNAFGASISPTARIYGSARIWYPPNLSMAGFSVMGTGVNCYCMAPISIGSYAVVSQGAHLCSGSHDHDDPDFQLFASPIAVGEKAWIAAEAFVGPGVVIGPGAVLGARGVTVKSLPSWTIHAGNPARAVGQRKPH